MARKRRAQPLRPQHAPTDPAKEAATAARFAAGGRDVPIPVRPGKQDYECAAHGCYMVAGPSGLCTDCELADLRRRLDASKRALYISPRPTNEDTQQSYWQRAGSMTQSEPPQRTTRSNARMRVIAPRTRSRLF
jgi:hypothetical protein